MAFRVPLRPHYTPAPERLPEGWLRSLTDLFLDGYGGHGVALRDLEDDVHARLDVAEQVVTFAQLLRIVDGTDEELAAIGVRTGVRHRQGAGGVLAEHRFVVELVARAAGAGSLRVAALDDEIGDHAVELKAVVILVARQEDEVIDAVGGQLGVEAERDRPLVGLHRDQEVVRSIDAHRWR